MRKLISIILSLLLCGHAFSQVLPRLYNQHSSTDRMYLWADSVYNSMSQDERIGQLFMPVVDADMTAANKDRVSRYIADYKIGGILYSKGTAVNQAALTNFAQGLSEVPLLISLDGEWGLAMRLSGTTSFPRNMTLGAITDESLIRAYGEEVGRQCNEMGIHINFAPVLDVNTNPKNPVIGVRAYGEDKNLVARKGLEYSKGLESRNVMAVGKHFPGHGDTDTDSHFTLPQVSHDEARLNDIELFPFKEFINSGYAGMLTAHLAIPSLDDAANRPSSLSKKIVTDLLKTELGFGGLVFTDGLAMKGVSAVPNHCVKALQAGNDVLLGPTNIGEQFASVQKAVKNGDITQDELREKCIKILQYKYVLGLPSQKSINLDRLEGRLNTPQAELLNRKLYAAAMTVLKDDGDYLPVKNLDKRKIAVVSVGGGGSDDEFSTTVNKYLPSKSLAVPSMPVKRRQSQAAFQEEVNNRLNKEKAMINGVSNSNMLIIGVYSNKKQDVDLVNKLAAMQKDYVLVFFQSPYRMADYKSAISGANAVVMAYEDAPLAREYAAQLIFGGIPANGKLSVSVPELYAAGTGIQKDKTRLGYAVPEQMGMNSETLEGIDKLVEAGLESKAFPGCQVLVAKGGNVVYQKSFGFFDFAGTHKVENTDVYDLASVTKIAATVPALMKVRDEFQIQTQYKLSQYVPELNGTDKAGLTVSDALFHETGLPDSYPFYMAAIDIKGLGAPLFSKRRDENYRLQFEENTYAHKDYKFFPEIVSSDKTESCSLQVADGIYVNSSFPDTIMHKIVSMPLRNKGHYKYSCLNFVLLRHLVENVSKTPIDKYVESKIYAPIGAYSLTYNPLNKIDRSVIAPTENDRFLRHQILIGYVHDEIAAFEGGVEGNAGLFSNAGDLAKLLQVLLNGGTYGGERIFSEDTNNIFLKTRSSRSRRGLGFDKPDVANPTKSPTAKEAGASVVGHTGFTGTACWIDPDNDLIYIFLSNRVYPNRWNRKLISENYRTDIQSLIYQSFKR